MRNEGNEKKFSKTTFVVLHHQGYFFQNASFFCANFTRPKRRPDTPDPPDEKARVLAIPRGRVIQGVLADAAENPGCRVVPEVVC